MVITLLPLLVVVALGYLGYRAFRLVKRRLARKGKAQSNPSETPERARLTKVESVSTHAQPVAQPGLRGEDDSPRSSLPGDSAVALSNGSGDWAVETHGLTKHFGPNVAVENVDLRVPRGSAFGCLGPNGAGKTTLIRTLLGLTRADAGTMSLLGLPVPRERSRALAMVAAIVDEPRFYGHMSGRDNLLLLAAARGGDAESRIAPSLERVGLGARADDKTASYSLGMRQRLGVAACLIGDPDLLILDEPMNGLDPAGIQEMRTMIRNLVEEGRTVMLSSHLLDEVERTCDAVAILDHGRVVRQGPIDELVRGANVVVKIGCSTPSSAEQVVREANVATEVALDERGLTVTLPPAASTEVVAELNRRLVEAGISVYRLEEKRTSLEDWFLSVTSRLGEST